MAHPLFTTNAPKAQTSVVLPVNRNGNSATPFSYRQARRFGQNERTTFGGMAMMAMSMQAPPPPAPEPQSESRSKKKKAKKSDE